MFTWSDRIECSFFVKQVVLFRFKFLLQQHHWRNILLLQNIIRKKQWHIKKDCCVFFQPGTWPSPFFFFLSEWRCYVTVLHTKQSNEPFTWSVISNLLRAHHNFSQIGPIQSDKCLHDAILIGSAPNLTDPCNGSNWNSRLNSRCSETAWPQQQQQWQRAASVLAK